MKKILYICQGDDFAGAESYALTLIRGMAQRYSVECYLATFYDGPLSRYLQNDGIFTIKLFERNNIKSLFAICKYLKKNEIDLVHLIDLKSTLIGGPIAWACGVKNVSTLHGLPEFPRNFFKKLRYLISICVYFAILRFLTDTVVLVSNDLQRRLSFFLKKKSSKVIHNGLQIDETFEDKIQISEIRKKEYTIGAVGRLEKVKGHSYLLEAAKILLEERTDVRFQIVGIGSLEDDLKARAKRLGIQEKVEFLGYRNDVRKIIANMDIFVMPSLHEGIPYVLLEAMACGRAVICSGVGGIPEVIKDSSCGIIIKPSDPYAIYKSISYLLNDDKYRYGIGKKSKEHVKKLFSAKKMVDDVYGLYNDLF